MASRDSFGRPIFTCASKKVCRGSHRDFLDINGSWEYAELSTGASLGFGGAGGNTGWP